MTMLQACCTQSAATGITCSYLLPKLSTIPSKDEYVPATEQRTPVIMMTTHATICIDNDEMLTTIRKFEVKVLDWSYVV